MVGLADRIPCPVPQDRALRPCMPVAIACQVRQLGLRHVAFAGPAGGISMFSSRRANKTRIVSGPGADRAAELPVRYQGGMAAPVRLSRDAAMRIITAVTRPITPASAG
jgi:hypothetical protein